MRTVELCFGRYDREWTLVHVLSAGFGIEPKVYSMDAFSAFLQDNGGFFVNIRCWEQPSVAAAERISEVFQLFERIKTEKGPAHLVYAFLPPGRSFAGFPGMQEPISVYEEMRRKMEWEDWYGANLDALWDILTGLPYRGDDFVILRPRHYHGIPYGQDDAFTSAVDEICAVFVQAQEMYGEISV